MFVVFVSLKCQSMAINIKSPGAEGGLGKDSGSPGTALGRISWEEGRWERDGRWGQKKGCWVLGAELVSRPTGGRGTDYSLQRAPTSFIARYTARPRRAEAFPHPP